MFCSCCGGGSQDLASRIFPDGKIAQPALAVFAFRFAQTKTSLRAASPDVKHASLLPTKCKNPAQGRAFAFCCGGGTCTRDLQVMSLASYYCSTPLSSEYLTTVRYSVQFL